MADTKTSAESAASALGGTELVRGVQSAANVKITIDQVKTWCSASPTLVTPVLGVAVATSLVTAAGTVGAAALKITVGDDAGFYRNASNQWAFTGEGTTPMFSWLAAAGYPRLRMAAAMGLTWTDGDGTGADELAIGKIAAASFRHGNIPSATPVAQTVTVGEASIPGTSSNIGGGNGTLRPGLGTGTGTLAKLFLQGSVIAAGGTGAQTYATAISINATGATGLQFNGYGAGAITADGSGNLTAASDPSMKHIQREFSPGLAEINLIKPIVYKWRAESGMEPEHEYAGFDAQNVRDAIPMATWKGKDGMLSLQDRALLAACVNAINELAARPGNG